MSTGIIYDERMAEHKCLWDLKYNEKPERFTRILQRCKELKLIERCVPLKPREVTEAELLKLHAPEMISILKSTEDLSDEAALEELSSHYDFLYIHPSTYRLSLLAAGSTIDLVDSILDGKVRNGMAIIRPPGHHAMKSEYCGYCYYNNVALAAQHALDKKDIKKILIVDWDIHHGQATQQMFYDDPRVLYFSIHGFQNGLFWPHLRESDYHFIGRGAGMGYNINLPMNQTKMGNQDYMAIFQQLLLPIAYEFNPELVIVSAGYDAALGCPEGEMEITPACYGHFTSSLMALAGGKVAVVLEGGYCLKSLAEGAALTLRTLLGDPCPAIDSFPAPCESVRNTILDAAYVLRPHWTCLQKHFELFSSKDIGDASRIRTNQHWPRIEFHGPDEKPSRYPTRDICPVQDPAVAAALDVQLDDLIKRTCLDVPHHRISVVDSCPSGPWKGHDLLKRCNQLEEGQPLDQTIVKLMDSLIDGSSRNGVVISEHVDVDTLNALNHVLDNRQLERVLCVDCRMNQNNGILVKFQEDRRILYASLYATELGQDFVGLKDGQGFTVNVGLPADAGDAVLMSALFRVLLPVGYQYNPQLIVVLMDSGSGQPSRIFEHIVHHFMPIGRLALFYQGGRENSSNIPKTLENSFKALLGDMITLPAKLETASEHSAIIPGIVRVHRPYWTAFQFDIQLPDENVLIPPWMNDAQVSNSNPELGKIFHD